MKERLLEEIQKGSKGAVMKKHIITYLIYNENSTITDLAKERYGFKYSYRNKNHRRNA